MNKPNASALTSVQQISYLKILKIKYDESTFFFSRFRSLHSFISKKTNNFARISFISFFFFLHRKRNNNLFESLGFSFHFSLLVLLHSKIVSVALHCIPSDTDGQKLLVLECSVFFLSSC